MKNKDKQINDNNNNNNAAACQVSHANGAEGEGHIHNRIIRFTLSLHI